MSSPAEFLEAPGSHGRAPGAQLWRPVALIAVLTVLGWSYLAGAFGVGEGSLAATAQRIPGLFTPAPYAFAIWGPILGALLAYAIAALRRPALRLAFPDAIAPTLTRVSLFAVVWVVAFQLELGTLSFLFAMLVLARVIALHARVSRAILAGEAAVGWRVPFGLLLGWMLVASGVTLNAALWRAGSVLPLEPTWTIAMLALVSGVALLIARRDRDPVVPLVVSWGVVAIAAADREIAPLVAWAALLAAASTTVGALAIAAPLMPRPTPSSPARPGALVRRS